MNAYEYLLSERISALEKQVASLTSQVAALTPKPKKCRRCEGTGIEETQHAGGTDRTRCEGCRGKGTVST
jgi:DnaJ-class molecular chaperone